MLLFTYIQIWLLRPATLAVDKQSEPAARMSSHWRGEAGNSLSDPRQSSADAGQQWWSNPSVGKPRRRQV